MNTYIALLRAINVAGHASVKMSDLRRAFVAAGCKDVRTYIQSGNVIFKSADSDLPTVARRILSKLNKLLGSEATVVFRTRRDVEGVVRAAPFKNMETAPDVKLYVSFLSRKPTGKPRLPFRSLKEALEAVKLKDLEVFVVSRKTNGRYGFPNNFVEKEFGVLATTRNWSTVKKMVELSMEQ